MQQPLPGRLLQAKRWARLSYPVEVNAEQVGSIEEPHWFSRKRRLQIRLPASEPLVQQTFRAFLDINSAFR